jgi:hypothetical protein
MRYAVAVLFAVLFATSSRAQEVEIAKPAPPPPTVRPEREVISPGLYDETRPSDADIYPRGGLVRYDPAFLDSVSMPYTWPKSTGRIGLGGWVSPNTPIPPMSSGWKEVSGYFALGFSVIWDGPMPVRRPAAPIP